MLEDGELTRVDTKDVFLYLTVTVWTFYLGQGSVLLNEFFHFQQWCPWEGPSVQGGWHCCSASAVSSARKFHDFQVCHAETVGNGKGVLFSWKKSR